MSRKKVYMATGVAVFLCILFYGAMKTTEKEIKEFSAFFAVPGESSASENRIKNRISEITGAQATVDWLTGQTVSENIESMIQKGEYPYLKEYLNEKQRASLYKDDGHIYFIPPFGVIWGQNTATINSGEAFWIQKRVLEWGGYPELETLDEYFDLIYDYLQEHPDTDGEKNTGFAILCEDWRYFCLENPPMFLAGYPNDGCAIVDPVTRQASVYDT